MFFEHRAFWLPKDTRRETEYEDAYQVDPVRGIAAVADGVSAGIFSGSWARLLVDSVVAEWPEAVAGNSLAPWLGGLRQRWGEAIDVGSLAWHQKPKLKDGAASTLLAVLLSRAPADAPGPYSLFAYAVGDCCLFHVREGRVQRAFPIEDSRRFNQSPSVLRSVDRNQDHLVDFVTLEDHCQAGDLLALCSDAVAAWALGQLEAGRSPEFEAMWDMPPAVWRDYILHLRQQNLIRFDDSTLVLLRTAGVPRVSQQQVRRVAEEDWKEKFRQGAEQLKKKFTRWKEGGLKGIKRMPLDKPGLEEVDRDHPRRPPS